MKQNKLAKAVTITDFEEKLWEKIDAATNRRLITTEEADKLAEAVTRTTFEEELSKKINTSDNERLITAEEVKN